MRGARVSRDFTPHYLERAEGSQQRVISLEPRHNLARGSHLLEGLFLEDEVCLNVAMRGLDVLISTLYIFKKGTHNI